MKILLFEGDFPHLISAQFQTRLIGEWAWLAGQLTKVTYGRAECGATSGAFYSPWPSILLTLKATRGGNSELVANLKLLGPEHFVGDRQHIEPNF